MAANYNEMPSQNPKDFGQSLLAERKARGKTQLQLATEIGVNRKTIREMEEGGNVSLHTVFAALAALGMGLRLQTMRPNYEQLRKVMDDE